MRVKALELENFRGFESLQLDLDRPVTVLVGVNGSGKSSILKALGATLHFTVTRGKRLPILDGNFSMPGVGLDVRDLHLAATQAEVRAQLAFTENSEPYQSHPRLLWRPELQKWLGWQGFGDRGVPRDGSPSFMLLVNTDRYVGSATVSVTRMGVSDLVGSAADVPEDDKTFDPRPNFGRFLEWFKDREDAENARRVASRDLDLQDPQLQAVREAITALMPGFDHPRIERDITPFAMMVTKGGVEFRLDQLSDGERNLVALAGEIARRLAVTNSRSTTPRETEGVVLIDEVEQHLHPAVQRKMMPSLRRAFPNLQFIVTTHSPQVVASVPAESVFVLKDFAVLRLSHPTEGRDSTAILREVFGDPGRPHEAVEQLDEVRALIDAEKLDEAREKLAALTRRFSEQDDDVLDLRTRLDFAEVGL